jgi:hypothetical protein
MGQPDVQDGLDCWASRCFRRRKVRWPSRSRAPAAVSTAVPGSGMGAGLLSCNSAPSDRTREWYAPAVPLDAVLKWFRIWAGVSADA